VLVRYIKFFCFGLLLFGLPAAMAWITHTNGAGYILFLFALLLIVQIRSIIQGMQNSQWPITEGLIVDSHKVLEDIGTGRFSVRVTYKYSVKAKEYLNNTPSLKQDTEMHNLASAEAFLDKYPIGKTVEVYYNPKRPYTSVLETGLGDSTPWFVLVLLIMVMLGAGAWMILSKIIN